VKIVPSTQLISKYCFAFFFGEKRKVIIFTVSLCFLSLSHELVSETLCSGLVCDVLLVIVPGGGE